MDMKNFSLNIGVLCDISVQFEDRADLYHHLEHTGSFHCQFN